MVKKWPCRHLPEKQKIKLPNNNFSINFTVSCVTWSPVIPPCPLLHDVGQFYTNQNFSTVKNSGRSNSMNTEPSIATTVAALSSGNNNSSSDIPSQPSEHKDLTKESLTSEAFSNLIGD